MFRRQKSYGLQNYEDIQSTQRRSLFSVYKGLLLAMSSAVFYSAASVLVKLIDNIHPGQLAMYRYLAVFTFSFPAAVKSQQCMLGPSEARVLLFIAGISGSVNLFLNFLAFRYLPLGESSVIIFSLPVFVTLAARLYLKEPCGVFQTATVFTTVAGIVCTSKLPLKLSNNSVAYTTESVWGLLAAISSIAFATCQAIVARQMTSLHYSIHMINYGWMGIAVTAALTALVGDFRWHECGLQGLYIALIGVIGYVGQSLLTEAVLCEMAGPVFTMRAAVDIVLAFLWQVVVFQDIPDALSIGGAFLVGLSVIFVGLYKWVSELPPDSNCGRRMDWVLK